VLGARSGILSNQKLWVEDHKGSSSSKALNIPKRKCLGLFELPGCWITLPYYRDDESGKIKRDGVTRSGWRNGMDAYSWRGYL